jgi:hypothetical protein
MKSGKPKNDTYQRRTSSPPPRKLFKETGLHYPSRYQFQSSKSLGRAVFAVPLRAVLSRNVEGSNPVGLAIGAKKMSALVLFVGGLAFWLPSMMLHCLHGDRFGVVDVILTSVVCPAFAGVVLGFLRFSHPKYSLTRLASWFILGVWAWGPPAMLTSAGFSGGGVRGIGSLAGFLLVWLVFPLSTPILATYDGSLFALALMTLAVGVVVSADR